MHLERANEDGWPYTCEGGTARTGGNTAGVTPMKTQQDRVLRAEIRSHWPVVLQREIEMDFFNGAVGSVLVSETEELRVWHLKLSPKTRCRFHRHVLDYFWTAHTAGEARVYYHDGRIEDVVHYAGETKHFKFSRGEFFVHSVENVGETELVFTTVEFLESTNDPLPIPDEARLELPTCSRSTI